MEISYGDLILESLPLDFREVPFKQTALFVRFNEKETEEN
ncbi:hypothetical protein LEP1GSC005_2648 [Leptospira santarosai str. ST188]|nr:Uncharacterized protein XB15_00565 [Leptospira santarosai]EMF91672.1 hypothetical protein LEP1GSC005_2648 [Leptospira santarosai str. ST188]EMO71958.1 hypothetical protein LEP1GSC130_0688 [Leptospira santarosai str. 200403458]EMO98597.1 hypothetical protein LEP1GSC120_1601 [Leptospira santarosai str. 200702252]